jgi:predicted transcriptional regulator
MSQICFCRECERDMIANHAIKDKLDMDIVREVTENQGVRLCELSRILNRDVMTIRYRILELERNGILRLDRGNHRTLTIYSNLKNIEGASC